ncbi:MAG: polysaccharide pyruvyl transferase family protein [Bryobacteraceae bacterium]
MYRVFIHRGTGNLGDAIQTIALCRLLGKPCRGVYRDSRYPVDGPLLVANGWLGHRGPDRFPPALFAGIHLAWHEGAFTEWMRRSEFPIGARDSYTKSVLGPYGIGAEMAGCATLTFERYQGARRGRYSIDAREAPGAVALTNEIGNLAWPKQWTRASELLELLRRAELVYTSRLHVALPCLAFGTPVIFPAGEFERLRDKERLTILGEADFRFGEAVTADVTALAGRYVRFVENALGKMKPTRRPRCPAP